MAGIGNEIFMKYTGVQFRVPYDRWMKEVKKHFLQG